MFRLPSHLSLPCPTLSLGAVTLATAIVAMTAQPSPAQSRYERQVEAQLDAAAMAVGGSGYEMVYDPYIDRTGAGITDNLTVTLYEGVSYTIIGVCDEDCSDLDMELFDANGNSIDSDYETDDFPVVEVTPAWTSEFTLDVHMFDCSNEPCYYGVGVFAY
ncbi:MAG: hypothetical protein ACO4CG_01740 [Prochlorothrix sp.]|nr:hypothetical protein [Prochlorothrix sp.]